MLGRVTDILGQTFQQASPGQYPQNRYLSDQNLNNPLLSQRMSTTKAAELNQQRLIEFKLLAQKEAQKVAIQNHEEQVFSYGGIAYIPPASVWKSVGVYNYG